MKGQGVMDRSGLRCNLCGLEHRGWVTCAKAAADQVKAAGMFGKAEAESVANTIAATIANRHGPADKPAVKSANRTEAEKQKRREYMRELMRKRRAALVKP